MHKPTTKESEKTMTTQTTVARIGPLTIHRINSSQNSLAAGDVDDQPICDDGSIFLSACQSFFGQEDQQHDPPPKGVDNNTDNDDNGVEVVGSPSQGDSAHSKEQRQRALSTLPRITLPECSSNNTLFRNNSRLLYNRRVRSMSPPSHTNTTNDDQQQLLFYNCSPVIHYGGSDESDISNNNNWSTSYFETSDFTAQTWLNVLQETETIRYCGAGEFILIIVMI